MFKTTTKTILILIITSIIVIFSYYSTTLAGVFLGILSSLLAWAFLFHYLIPTVSFGQYIAKTKVNYNKSGYIYRFKIENTGTRRIIDIDFYPLILISGLRGNKQIERIKPVAGTKKTPLLIPGKARYIAIQVDKTKRFGADYMPDLIKEKYNNGTLTLEDVLSSGTKAQLLIYVFGYDEFSGTRKLFESKIYEMNDIKQMPIKDVKMIEGNVNSLKSMTNNIIKLIQKLFKKSNKENMAEQSH